MARKVLAGGSNPATNANGSSSNGAADADPPAPAVGKGDGTPAAPKK